jgi:CRP/FNR family transcriptional regulator
MTLRQIEALKRTTLFGSLTHDVLAEIAERAKELHCRRGEMLFFAGEEAKGLFVVVQGKVRVFQHSPAGREQVMHVDTGGAVIAEVPVFDDGPYPATAACDTDVDVLFISKEDMWAFCAKYPPLSLRALRLMAQRVRRHAQLIESLSFHEVGQRLALFLISEAQRANAGSEQRIEFPLNLSNHQVANRIGSVRDVVARAFARLKHEGLIESRGRTLIIPDVEALKRYTKTAHRTPAHANHLSKSA